MKSVALISRIGILVVVLALTPSPVPADTTCNSSFNTGTDPADCGGGTECPMQTGIPIYCTALFCDDMDRYCVGAPACPPEPPNPCLYVDGNPTGPTTDSGHMADVWVKTSFNENDNTDGYNHLEGTGVGVEKPTYTPQSEWTLPTGASMPYGMRYPNGGSSGNGDPDRVGQQTVDLRPYIQIKHGAENTTINGTDTTPLVLSFTMSSGIQSASGMGYNTGYFEMALQTNTTRDPDAPGHYPAEPEDDSKSPMDYVMVGADQEDKPGGGGDPCFDCYNTCEGETGARIPWPTVCQAYERSPLCPPEPAEEHIWNVLAVGTNALLDTNPCHCEYAPDQVPHNTHLSFFDGHKWMILTASNAPGFTGEFVYADKIDTVTLTIRSDTVDIYHRANITGSHPCVDGFCTGGGLSEGKACTANSQCKFVESKVVGIPRRYFGAFNRLRVGTSHACELRDDQYQCKVVGGVNEGGVRKPIKMGDTGCYGGLQNNKAGHLIFDNVYLKDGVPGGAQPGACCYPDASCSEVTLFECPGVFHGEGASCEATLCCHAPVFADADDDGDVDHYDFAKFQLCYSGLGTIAADDPCQCYDTANADDRIDADDFDKFKDCASGPSVAWAPTANCP
jgi:hypothetical protein